MYVPEIIEVKENFEMLKQQGFILKWELPYENLLTRRSAAIFFFTPSSTTEDNMNKVISQLSKYPNFSFRSNTEKKISTMDYRVTFSVDEIEKNKSLAISDIK